jgi:arylsulfatase A-like enzyme
MRKQGYHTAQIGKWHTGTNSGWGRDWDRQVVWNRPLHTDNAGAYYQTQVVEDDGVERRVEGYPADNYTQWAVDYIKGEKRDTSKPWYLWLCYGSVHGPSTPAERHLGRYKDAEVPVPEDIFPPRPGKPDYLNRTQSWTKNADGYPVAGKGGEAFGETKREKRFDDWVRQVNECVPAIDEGVGRLIATLKETKQWEKTLVIYSADQGFSMGEHGFRTKLAPYDANYRSPLILSQPGRLPAGKVCRHPANGPDLLATILSFTSVKVPWALHGRDLTPLLENPEATWPHACLYENMDELYGADARAAVRSKSPKGRNRVPRYTAAVQDGWKYVRYYDGTSEEDLYDLNADPKELKNLATQPEHQVKKKQLAAEMSAELQRTEAGF